MIITNSEYNALDACDRHTMCRVIWVGEPYGMHSKMFVFKRTEPLDCVDYSLCIDIAEKSCHHISCMDGPEQRFDILYLNFIDVYLRELQNEVRRIYGTSRSQGFTNEPRRHTERGGWDRDRILKLFKETCDKK